MSDIMNKIKIVSLGGLNENGKNTYVIEIDEKIFGEYNQQTMEVIINNKVFRRVFKI